MEQQFGRCTLIEPLGRGGMGEVQLERAGEPGFERPFARKSVRTVEGEKGERLLHALRTEARLALQLVHPNIAQVFEFGQNDGQFVLSSRRSPR